MLKTEDLTIALITDGIWPYVIGGMQKHSYYLCRYLAKNKVNVILIHTALEITEDVKNITCFSEDERIFIKSIVVEKPPVPSFPGHYIYQSYCFSRKVYKELGGFPKADFIIAKGMTGLYFLNRKNDSTPPIAINIHGYEFMQKKASIRGRAEAMMLRLPLTFLNRKADYVFSYGGKITEYIKQLGVPPKNIIELPAAIEKDWMCEPQRSRGNMRNFLFVGRFERRKGIEELLKVIGTIEDKWPFTFSFVGPIPEDQRIRKENILYHGIIQDKRILQELINRSDVLICPSFAEGMPNVIIEAMANGCTVIATDVGAVSQLVNGDNGWLIPPGNEPALKAAMLGALQLCDEEIYRKKMAAYRHIEENFLWPDVIGRLIREVTKIIGK